MTLLGDIVSAYRGFGPSMRKQLAPEAREEKMLLYVMLATLIFFAARIPSLLDVAKNTSDAELTMTNIIGANFATSIFFGPLMLYGIAALSHLIAKPFGGKATFQEARLAFFWTLLVISPIVLLSVVLRAFIPAPEFVAIGNMAVLVVFIYCWSVCLSIAEKFKNAIMTTVSIVAIFAVLFGAIQLLFVS